MMIAALSILLAAISLTVRPLPGESHTTGTGRGIHSSFSGSQSRSMKRNMKWRLEMRIRENRPEKLSLNVIYIATTSEGKLKELKRETKAVTLDKNGCAVMELVSPMTTQTKTRTTVSRGSSFGGLNSGFRSTKSTIRGDRVTGCIIQVFADGKLAKGWASDSRWTRAAQCENVSIGELEKNGSKIGLR